MQNDIENTVVREGRIRPSALVLMAAACRRTWNKQDSQGRIMALETTRQSRPEYVLDLQVKLCEYCQAAPSLFVADRLYIVYRQVF